MPEGDPVHTSTTAPAKLPAIIQRCDYEDEHNDCREPGIEVRYLYAYKSTGGIAQPCYFGKQRTDVRREDCTTAQLKWKATPED